MTKLAYPPRNDAMFKMIFGDKRSVDILTAFLKATLDLPEEDYEEVILVDSHLAREHPEDKLGILDVKLKTRLGKIIDLEIQLCDQPQMRERIIFYLARMITEQIGAGGDYGAIKRAICILIADFVLEGENAHYHQCYTLRNKEGDLKFTDLLEIHTVELPKLPQDDDGTPLWDWLKFLAAQDKEELTMLAEKNPQVKKAVARYMELTEDEHQRMLAESREKLRRDISAAVHGAEIRGMEKGLFLAARNLLNLNRPVDEIAQITGLSPEVIRSLSH